MNTFVFNCTMDNLTYLNIASVGNSIEPFSKRRILTWHGENQPTSKCNVCLCLCSESL